MDVFSGVCLFVCLFVCQHDNFRTINFFCSGPRGRELCRPPVLRRWENQRMLSSFVTVLMLPSGVISQCGV